LNGALQNPVFSLEGLYGIFPEMTLLLGAFGALTLEIFWPQPSPKRRLFYWTLASILAAFWFTVSGWSSQAQEPFPGFLASDTLASAAKIFILAVTLLTVFVGSHAAPELGLEHAEYYALLLLAAFGIMLLAGSTHFISAFVSLETFSLAMYVLAGFNKRLHANREAALKYFLLGAFAAAFFLFGTVLIYGACADLSYQAFLNIWHSPATGQARHLLAMMGLLLVMVAFAFKVGLVPFHFWAPDTYEGAPTPVTAFLSAGAKVAGMTALLRLLLLVFPDRIHPDLDWLDFKRILTVLSILTMTLANLAALRQTSVKRLLAYSSVSHSGYALLGLVAGSAAGASAVLAYVLVYALMNFCAFGLVLAAESGLPQGLKGKTLQISDLNGLGFVYPLFGAALTVAMFSLAGLPPTAGFIAKFSLFRALAESGNSGLLVVAVLNSLVAAGYYLPVLVALYMKPAGQQASQPKMTGLLSAGVYSSAFLLLLWGVHPGNLLDFTSLTTLGFWR
jgi:NADH-quinone oxidoreductase subunit N